jgi:hypothetical protein
MGKFKQRPHDPGEPVSQWLAAERVDLFVLWNIDITGRSADGSPMGREFHVRLGVSSEGWHVRQEINLPGQE